MKRSKGKMGTCSKLFWLTECYFGWIELICYLGYCHLGKDISQESSFDWFCLGCRFGFWHSCEHARTLWDKSDARRTGGRRDDADGLHRTLCIWHQGMIGFFRRSSDWMAPRSTSPIRSISSHPNDRQMSLWHLPMIGRHLWKVQSQFIHRIEWLVIRL